MTTLASQGANDIDVAVGTVAAPSTGGSSPSSPGSPSTLGSPPAPDVQWGLIGDSTTQTPAELAAGITDKVVRISWKDFETSDGVFSASYASSKLAEIQTLEQGGMRVILDLGIQDAPSWIHAYPDSYLVDQYGEAWSSATDPAHEPIDEGDANLIFNPQLRAIAQTYIQHVAAAFGPYAYAVRVGGGRFNELGYPAAHTVDHTNTYWAYDALAQAQSPVPGWKPGDPSPQGQAGTFLGWYLGSLTAYEQWQIATVRAYFAGPLMVLFPGWGIRPGQVDAAAADDLDGHSTAEVTGETQMGHDFAAQVAAINTPGVWVETTWLDAAGDDSSAVPARWTPVHYLSSLAATNPLAPSLWGENTGQGSEADMVFTVAQAQKYDLMGIVWYDESELFSGDYAGLESLAAAITTVARDGSSNASG